MTSSHCAPDEEITTALTITELNAAIPNNSGFTTILLVDDLYEDPSEMDINNDRPLVIVGTATARSHLTRTKGSRFLHFHGTAPARLIHVQVSAVDGPAIGVDGANAELTLEDCVVGPSSGVGISAASDATLIVLRSRIRDNDGAGMFIDVADFVIENTMSFGNSIGIDLFKIPGPSARIDHATVVDNADIGVRCSEPTDLRFAIVAGNGVSQLSGSCTAFQSGIEGGGTANANFDEAPAFEADVDGDDDFHLAAGSPGLGHATSSTTTLDIDGERRPAGAGDAGADERR